MTDRATATIEWQVVCHECGESDTRDFHCDERVEFMPPRWETCPHCDVDFDEYNHHRKYYVTEVVDDG